MKCLNNAYIVGRSIKLRTSFILLALILLFIPALSYGTDALTRTPFWWCVAFVQGAQPRAFVSQIYSRPFDQVGLDIKMGKAFAAYLKQTQLPPSYPAGSVPDANCQQYGDTQSHLGWYDIEDARQQVDKRISGIIKSGLPYTLVKTTWTYSDDGKAPKPSGEIAH